MPSVPTAAIIHRNPRPVVVYGQATPCRTTTQESNNPPFPRTDLARKIKSSSKLGVQVIKSKQVDLDFHIEPVQPTPRLG
jgi:hypothetical protein